MMPTSRVTRGDFYRLSAVLLPADRWSALVERLFRAESLVMYGAGILAATMVVSLRIGLFQGWAAVWSAVVQWMGMLWLIGAGMMAGGEVLHRRLMREWTAALVEAAQRVAEADRP